MGVARDAVAAATIAAVAIPSSLGYAEVAGLPVVVGLYATMLPLVGYAIWGSSRHVIVGPEGALAALTAVTIAPLAAGDPARYAALAAALALMMGLVLLASGVLRLGFMADFFSRPVLLGYVNGIALTIIAGQLPKLLGISVSADDFFRIIGETLEELGSANQATVLLSAGMLVLLLTLRRFVPRVPGSLVVIVTAIVLSEWLDLASRGVATVGTVASGLPSLELPNVGVHDINDLALPAAAFALVAFADTVATARTFAAKSGYEVDANRELAGLGGANIASGLTQAFPVSCSGSRTAVAHSSGVGSQVAGLVTAGIVALIAVFAAGLLDPLPKAALGVVIIGAALTLFELESVWRLRQVRAAEVALALATTLGVLLFGVLGGVVLAIGLSIGVFVYRVARPHDAVLGHDAGVDGYRDVGRNPAQLEPGLLVYRMDAPLFFPNADYFRRRVRELVDAAEPRPEWVVVTAEAWIYVDATAISALRQLRRDLAADGITLCVARPKGRLREIFEDTGFSDELGRDHLFPTVRAAVAAFRERSTARADG